MLTQTQLKEIFQRYGFRPLKRFGENYLIDNNIKEKIIGEVSPAKGAAILEIGPGLGALTLDLAGSGARVYAVEKDRKAFDILTEMAGDRFPNLKLFYGDILRFDIGGISPKKKLKVVGNLPYYITTPIIDRLIENRKYVKSAVIMTQREVAERLIAAPGSDDYSSLSCFVRYFAMPKYIYTVRRGCFYPAPDVDSSLIRLDILDKPSVDVADEALFFKVIRGSFNQRRKSIINSLSRDEVLGMPKDRLSRILKSAGIDPFARPESLGLAEFARITDALAVSLTKGRDYDNV